MPLIALYSPLHYKVQKVVLCSEFKIRKFEEGHGFKKFTYFRDSWLGHGRDMVMFDP